MTEQTVNQTDSEVTSNLTSPNVTAEIRSPSIDKSSQLSDLDSPMLVDSSELTSPSNTSTSIKQKNIEVEETSKRRLSNRVRAKPAFFDASPIVSVSSAKSVTPSLNLTSPLATEEVDNEEEVKLIIKENRQNDSSLEEEEDDTLEEDIVEEVVLKTTKTPISNKKQTSKTPLNVTVKKGKASSARKSTTDKSSLFELVKNGKSAVVSIIDEWIELYNSEKITALVDLVQFFVDASGCKAKVTKEMVDEEDTVRAIRHLTENFGEQGEEYPLIISRPEFKKFNSNFSSFVLHLINLSQHSIIYDGDLMDILVCWVIGLSDSQVRAFRHTSTLAGMKIVTGLIDVAKKIDTEYENTEGQYSAENQKTAGKKSREKLEKLKKRKEELKSNKAELEDMMNRIFSGIFMHRYRDLRPEIRAICISELGSWMVKYSEHFLDQIYLKYLGWMLFDKVGDVRLQVLKALEQLYQDENYTDNLQLFTGRFKSRLIHMTLDVDNDVAVQAIKIASLLYSYDMLEEDDCSQVEQLVFCDQRNMAHAAGEFLSKRIEKLSLQASPKKLNKAHKETFMRQMNVKAILDFFIKTEIHTHTEYLVDSLWDHTDLLKDWRMMTNLLLDTNSLIDLEDEEETALIDLLCSSCKQAATGVPPPGRLQNKKISQKDKKILEEDRQNISSHFMEHLAALLEKFKSDVPKITLLMTIPQYFELEVYAEKRLAKHLESLLKHMEDVVLKHADDKLLQTCSVTYHYLLDNDLALKQTVDISKNKVLEEIVGKFQRSIAHGVPSVDDDKESPAYYNCVTNLRRMKAFAQHHDLTEWGIYDNVNSIIEQGVNGTADDDILKLSVCVMYMLHCFALENLLGDEPEKADIKALRKKQKVLVKQLDELLQFLPFNEVKCDVFKVLCDYFMLFAKQLANKAPKLTQLICEANRSLQVRMRDFILTHVLENVNEEKDDDEDQDDAEAKELYEKRELLAGLCKLIAFRVFDAKIAANIYGKFLKTYSDYADIIKTLMQKAKEDNIILFSRVLLFSLEQQFENLKNDENGAIDSVSKEFSDLKDLARRFSLLLGVNINSDNTRKSTITIHRDGIDYAFRLPSDMTESSPANKQQDLPPPHLIFLEVLHEFTNRVTTIDKKVILKYLEDVAGDLLLNAGVPWAPIRTYRNGLNVGDNQTKIYDEAEEELEVSMMKEKGKPTKKKSFSFANQTKTIPAKDKKKMPPKKKLSLSTVGGSDKWLSKKAIDQSDNPKIAKGIPKARKSTSSKKTTKSPTKNGQAEGIEDQDGDASSKQTPKKSLQKNAKRSPVKSVKKSPAKKTTISLDTSSLAKKKTPAKKGSTAKTPIKLSASVAGQSPTKSPARNKRKTPTETPLEDSDVDSDVTSSRNGEQDSINSPQASWISSQNLSKKCRINYGSKSASPLKRSRDHADDSNSQDSDVSTPSAREMRAAKRQKRDEPSDLFSNSQELSQESSQELPQVL